MTIRTGLPVLLVAAAVALVACGSDQRDKGSQPSAASSGTGSAAAPDTTSRPTMTDTSGTSRSAPKESMNVDPAIAQIQQQIDTNAVDKSKSDWKTRLSQPAKATFTPGKNYFWNIKTNKGDIKVRLMPDVAPLHVTSTMYLTMLGFYDGLAFHRVIPGFMAQGGCPLGNGTGSPGYGYNGEFSPAVRHNRPGLLSMANTGRPNSDGSQFFLTFVPTPHLDNKHTIFGEVVEGMETLKTLESLGTSPAGTPRERLLMEKATITVE